MVFWKSVRCCFVLTIFFGFLVFDFCLTKVMKVNPITKIPQLTLQWTSVSNSLQRRGKELFVDFLLNIPTCDGK